MVEVLNLYISGKAKRREAIAYIDQKIKKEKADNRNSEIWKYIYEGIEREKCENIG